MPDKYANLLFDEVTESGTNTLTFKELNFGVSLFDKKALLIHSIHWYQFDSKLIATSDNIQFGVSQSKAWTVATPSEPSIVTMRDYAVRDHGTAANALIWERPHVDDFSTFPGGGLLVVPKPLFLFIVGANLAAAAQVQMRLYFTFVEMKDAEYLELLETRMFFG